jgi:hypothetical protein
MTNSQTHSIAETRKQRLLREALVDIRALVPVVGAADGAHRARPDNFLCRPETATEESTMQAIHDNDEVKRHGAVGIGVCSAIVFSVVASLATISAQAPVSTAHAQLAPAATRAVPDASTVFDASSVVEPLPPTF